jgi:hypothetical protein
MREPLHQPVPWAEVPADIFEGFGLFRGSAGVHHRAGTLTPTGSQFRGDVVAVTLSVHRHFCKRRTITAITAG